MTDPIITLPHGTEELRQDLHAAIIRYPELTVVETLGTLELVKADMIERLRGSG